MSLLLAVKVWVGSWQRQIELARSDLSPVPVCACVCPTLPRHCFNQLNNCMQTLHPDGSCVLSIGRTGYKISKWDLQGLDTSVGGGSGDGLTAAAAAAAGPGNNGSAAAAVVAKQAWLMGDSSDSGMDCIRFLTGNREEVTLQRRRRGILHMGDTGLVNDLAAAAEWGSWAGDHQRNYAFFPFHCLLHMNTNTHP